MDDPNDPSGLQLFAGDRHWTNFLADAYPPRLSIFWPEISLEFSLKNVAEITPGLLRESVLRPIPLSAITHECL
jgi:hypothetical protein